MARKNSPKKQGNLDKIKREMSEKKQKAEMALEEKAGPKADPAAAAEPEKELFLQGQEAANAPARAAGDAAALPAGTEEFAGGEGQKKEESANSEGQKKEESVNSEEQKKEESVNSEEQEKEEPAGDGKIQLVVFRVDKEEFALRIAHVKEIIRIPSITQFPNAPEHIHGLCSLRGELLPVLDGRKLFGLPPREAEESSRILVADIQGKKVGLISDKVLEVITVEETAVKEPPANLKGADGVIEGILILQEGKRVVMLLDAGKVIKLGDFELSPDQASAVAGLQDSGAGDGEEQIVIFSVGEGEYAFDVRDVKEIIRLPALMKVPNGADYIEGVFSIRNELLAALNLGRLLGMKGRPDENSRVVIIHNGSFSCGVIVDKVSQILRVRKDLLKAGGKGPESGFVKGIFNLNEGRRLVMLLEPRKLVSLEELQGALKGDQKRQHEKSTHAAGADQSLECVVFRLGEEEYGIDIHHVQEINRMKEITRFPGAPAFIDGMVDLRGEIIPILNLRSLFALPHSEAEKASKFLVAELGEKKIGILIDSVSEVQRFSTAQLEEAPDMLKEKEQEGYIEKIAKLNDGKRVVLILNLEKLLSFM